MRRTSRIVALIAACVLLTGCGATMTELAQARDECTALGGTFEQWQDGMVGNEHWRCNFDQVGGTDEQ